MAKLTETQKKQQKGRKHIAEFSSAMKFHDPDLQSTSKLMRNKLREIKQRESSAGSVLIKKPQTVQKVIFKFIGSKTVLHRRSPQTLLSPNHETDSRNASKTLSSCKRDQKMINNNNDGETLICKRRKMIKNNYGDDQDSGVQLTNSTKLSLENPRPTETMSDSNEGTVMDFIKRVGGSEAELVIEKRLTESDVTPNQGWLLIPVIQVKNRGFLTADEELMMGKKQDIRVSVFDPERRKWTLKLTKWKMSKEYYVFKTDWKHLVNANGLNKEMVIRVLSFRVDQQLCFALVRVA